MNVPLSEDLANSLLSQDPFFSSQEFAEHRREVIQRLGAAIEREKRARRLTVIISSCCGALSAVIYARAAYELSHASGWPEWGMTIPARAIRL